MKRWPALVLLLLCLPAAIGGEPEFRWIDAGELHLIGRGFGDADAYQRLPDRFGQAAPDRVWRLSQHAAGLAIRFSTDATEIRARWKTGRTWMPHMPPNAVMGLDLYVLDEDGARYLGTGAASGEGEHRATLGAELAPGTREMAVFLPLYERIESLEIGVPDGAAIGQPRRAFFEGPPVVVYGTSITQGACASRPGMAYPAILARLLRREVVNLGFSGTGRLDPWMADALGEIKAAAYVLDCLPNLDPEEVETRTLGFVRALRAVRPDTPILLVENIVYPGTHDKPSLRTRLESKNAALHRAVVVLRTEGLGANLRLVKTGAASETTDDETADGIHPTDAGMRRHAERLERVLRDLLADTRDIEPELP